MMGNCMEEAVVKTDGKGRILIPSRFRKQLKLKNGSRLKMRIVKGRIILEPIIPRSAKVRASRKWGREAFLDAGEATFGEY